MERLINIFYPEDRRYRTKQLFRVCWRIFGDIGQYGRLIKESWPVRRFSSCKNASAGSDTFFNVRVKCAHRVSGGQRTNIGLLVKRCTIDRC